MNEDVVCTGNSVVKVRLLDESNREVGDVCPRLIDLSGFVSVVVEIEDEVVSEDIGEVFVLSNGGLELTDSVEVDVSIVCVDDSIMGIKLLDGCKNGLDSV